MRTLHEMATKLQEFIIKQQDTAHDSAGLNTNKYNNLKLKMESGLSFPNIIVCIGISEAIFNFRDQIKIDGGLGPDEKYVKKWLGSSTVIQNLTEIYKHLSELVKAEDAFTTPKHITQEGEADEVKGDFRPKQSRTKLKYLRQEMKNSEDEDYTEHKVYKENIDITEYNYDESIMNDYDPTNPAGLESVEELKKDLKNLLKPGQRKYHKEFFEEDNEGFENNSDI